jgi:non-ribosomal peptide synthetase component E (peptide arylation enzyme)
MYAVQGVYTGGDTITVPHGAIQTSGERDKKIIAENAERFNAEVAETMLFQAL